MDDIKFFFGFLFSKFYDVIFVINEDFKEILIWCCRNLLFINFDKIKFLYIGVF